MTIQTMTLGYARMGKQREVKKALELFWNNTLDSDALLNVVRDVEASHWKTQRDAGADVISIENSRSNNRTLQEVIEGGYSHQIGNGIYDIHSPVIPTKTQLVEQLQVSIANLPTQQIWVNPDCGLKTRRWDEIVSALRNMVEAAKHVREDMNAN